MTHLSLTGKRWIVRGTGDEPASGASIVETLLRRRGVEALGEGEILETIGEDARRFRDFPIAEERIARAVATGERIGIFGDYDCDGITATVLLARYFYRRGIRPSLRLPHRLKEGYGLQTAAVEELASAGVRLLITVDTGVTALKQIARARELDIDVIVLDHHTLPTVAPAAAGAEVGLPHDLPPACAILHPALASPVIDPSPCAAGIAWSVVEALERREGNVNWDGRATDIALAAVGTVADIVELRGGNRTLTHSGLQALSTLTDGPLALLCAHAGLQSPYTSRDIAFRIAPRINAAGRMDDPHIALSALLGDSAALLQLDTLNRERQDVVSGHIENLLPRAEAEAAGMLCFVSDDYSPGICGLLASRLCELHGKPCLIAARSGALCSASLRSIPGYDVTAGLSRCSDFLLTFGGHAMAAGCTFAAANFPSLHERLRADATEYIAADTLLPTLTADCAIGIERVTTDLCDALAVLEPFGQGNPEPRFIIEDARLDNARRVGKEEKHLQATVRGRKAIGFHLAHLEAQISTPVDLLCRVGIDTWNGRRQPQLFLDDIRVSGKSHIQHSRNIPARKSSEAVPL